MNCIQSFDDRRDIAMPGDKEATINFSVEHFIQLANEAIADHQFFSVALSGGSTPNAIFSALANPENRKRIDWNKVHLYWSDERAVPPDHPDSNYRAAMQAGLDSLSIPPDHIFRMKAETLIEEHALEYENLILSNLSEAVFDLVMLGMGEDGHTASLFPQTHGLHSANRLVVANFVPVKQCWRMTLTFKSINSAQNIAIYVLGKSKSTMLEKALFGPYTPDQIPIQRVGTAKNKALWITDIHLTKFQVLI